MAVVSIDRKRRRIYGGEEVWFPLLDAHGASQLRLAFIACGVSPQVAGNLVWMIEDQRNLRAIVQASDTRARYRRILAELDPAEVARAIPG